MSCPGIGDVSADVNWKQFTNVETLKTICKAKGCSGFVTYKYDTGHALQGRVCWKKFAHQVNASHMQPNPSVDGIWIRKNFPSNDPVEGYSWEFVPRMSLPG